MSEAKPGVVFRFESWGEVIAKERGRLGITFDGRAVTQITRTIGVFWNPGIHPLYSRDIDRPVLFSTDGEVLAFRECNKRGSDVSLDAEAVGSLHCNFDFLQPGDGISFEVLHNGSDARARFDGRIKGTGVKPPPEVSVPLMERGCWACVLVPAAIIGILALIAAYIIANVFPQLMGPAVVHGWASLGVGIGIGAGILVGVVLLMWWSERNYDKVPRDGMPAYLLTEIHREWRNSPLWEAKDTSQPHKPDATETFLQAFESLGSAGGPKFASEGRILESSYGRLVRTYDGNGVARITHTVVALWNAGDRAIDLDKPEGGRTVRMSGPILAWNCYGIRPRDSRIDQNGTDGLTLSVAKLAPGDGVCLEAIHSGAFPAASCVGVKMAWRRTRWQWLSLLLDIGASLASAGGSSPTSDFSPFFSWRRFGIPSEILGQLDSGEESKLL